MTGGATSLFQISICIMLSLLMRHVKSDHEKLKDHHYMPEAGDLPVDKRYDFKPSSETTPSPPGARRLNSRAKQGAEKESYFTIACYPNSVRDDPLVCEKGCKVTDGEQSDCGPHFSKLFCNCTEDE